MVVIIDLLIDVAAEKGGCRLLLSNAKIGFSFIGGSIFVVPSQIQKLLAAGRLFIVQTIHFEQFIPVLAGIVDLSQSPMQILHLSLSLHAPQVLAASEVGKRVDALENLQGFHALEGPAFLPL